MITVSEQLDIRPSYDFSLLAPKERIIFFDIETTGFSPDGAFIYLIGAVVWEEGCWALKQYFAERRNEEAVVLEAFFRLVNSRKRLGRTVLISFNGDMFDIPFIKEALRRNRLYEHDFSGTLSVDLFRRIRPYRRLLGLENCSLKSVEKLCGIFREDKYNGGELIYVYEEYLRLAAIPKESCEYTDYNLRLRDEMLRVLLLHNAEDIADMPMIMQLLSYDSIFEGGFEIIRSSLVSDVWDIHGRLAVPVPKGIYREFDDYVVSVGEEDPCVLNIAVNLFEGELKYFFADYKNYYYLPAEDYAIHKSLGEFVDRKARRQATARTCYQRKNGVFVPEPTAVFAPAFYAGYKLKPAYGRLPDEGIEAVGDEKVKAYAQSVLTAMRDLK